MPFQKRFIHNAVIFCVSSSKKEKRDRFTDHRFVLINLDKDRYVAIVTQLDSNDRPSIVLYYADMNVNDQLLSILK